MHLSLSTPSLQNHEKYTINISNVPLMVYYFLRDFDFVFAASFLSLSIRTDIMAYIAARSSCPIAIRSCGKM